MFYRQLVKVVNLQRIIIDNRNYKPDKD